MVTERPEMRSTSRGSRSREKTWQALAPVAVVGTIGVLLVVVLSWQNITLRGDVAREGRALAALEETLVWNLRISGLEGVTLPAPWLESLRPDLATLEKGSTARTLLVVYTPTVCVTCLREGLRTIGEYHEELVRFGIMPHGLVGERIGAREFALFLREDGLLSFPVTFVPAEKVQGSVSWGREPGFTETPLYLLVDGEFKILTAFKADRQKASLLQKWLTAILETREHGGPEKS